MTKPHADVRNDDTYVQPAVRASLWAIYDWFLKFFS
jgi:hypothetical protein